MYYAPIFSFFSKCKSYKITEYLSIEIINNHQELLSSMNEDYFSKEERDSIRNCSHMLKITDSYIKFPDSNDNIEIINNIFLLACWIHKPFELYTKYIFGSKLHPERSDIALPYLFRILHRKRRNKNEESQFSVKQEDLLLIKNYFNKLIKINENISRLRFAFTFTFFGMISMTWIEAYIAFTTAFEILLTHKSILGIKKRLALACACILENSELPRNEILKEFCDLYKFRSNIVHGKYIENIDEKGYQYLCRVSNLLRKTWQKVLNNQNLFQQLQGSDSERKKLIQSLQGKYIPDFSFLEK